jgi:hypothetical protein
MPVKVGDQGVAESPLYLTGAVRINGERHMARSDQGPIDAGCAVIVVGDDMNGLVVHKIESGTPSAPLADHGRPVFTSSQERVNAAEAEREQAVEQEWTTVVRRGSYISAVCGVVTTAIMIVCCWATLSEQSDSAGMIAASLLLAGGGLGVSLYRLTDFAFGEMEASYRRMACLATCVGLVGFCIGGSIAIPLLGLGFGLAIAAFAGIIFAAAVLLFLVLVSQ